MTSLSADDSILNMDPLANIPDDFEQFLIWLKDRSQFAWANHQTQTLAQFKAEEMGGTSWRSGTRWRKGLDEPEIAALEAHWKLQFPKDHRQFLSILNAPDRGLYCVGWSDASPYGLVEDDDAPSFYDWQNDKEALVDALNWPLEGLIFDLEENALWLDSWGEQPSDDAKAKEKLARLVDAAPKLIPLTGHRYLLANSADAGNSVLSVWQSDIICYGSNLRNFLLLEFSSLLGLDYQKMAVHAKEGMTEEKIAAIPFWGEIMLRD